MAWVSKLFMRLHGRFGNGFFDKFRVGQTDRDGNDIGVENAKQVWAEELAGLAGEEIARGLATKFKFPPSCDEFLTACRPDESSDLEAMFHRAVREMQKRRDYEPQNWPSSRLYWAASRLGNDLLHQSYSQLKGRWAEAWQASDADRGSPVPDVAKADALPAPGKTTLSQEQVTKRVAGLRCAMFGKEKLSETSKRRLLENITSGKESPVIMEVSLATLRAQAPELLQGIDIPEALRSAA